MAYFKKLLAQSAALPIGFALLTAVGCTGANLATSEFAPTHRWARSDTSIAEYNFHNVRCVRDSDVNTGGAEPNSPEFLAYRECMEEKGFELMGLTTRG
ncbi:MAG: hypothetical protein OXE81_09560 [Gammaproteobacteria bacterium]|nr:hypothetical protein [Gammaproteobacteria bacterium]